MIKSSLSFGKLLVQVGVNTRQLMHPIRSHPRAILVTLGLLSVLVSYTAGGELFHGYGKSGGAYLLHVGVFALLLAGTMALDQRWKVDAGWRGLVVTIFALAALYPLAVAFIWYDLVVTPPPYYGANPSLIALAVDRLGFILALTPLSMGYVLGAYRSTSADTRSPVILILMVLLVVSGPALAYVIAVMNGSHPGFALLFYILLGFAGVIGSFPLYIIAQGRYDDR